MAELMVLKASMQKDAIRRLSVRFKATVAADVPEVPMAQVQSKRPSESPDGTIHRLAYGKMNHAVDTAMLTGRFARTKDRSRGS